jgi:chemotaxis protein MotA
VKLIFGIVFVFACVLGGYVLHHGKLSLLFVPTEYMIIAGCLIGGMIIQNPAGVLLGLIKDVGGLLGSGGPSRKHYLDALMMIYELMQLARKDGVLALEAHVNDPHESAILNAYPTFMKDHHAVAFLCDTLKLFVAGVLDAHNMDELMERDLEIIHREELETSDAMTKAADSLPAIGIVAAVLGIILTMSAIADGPEVVGMKVAGALVGTFLGVFLAYGLVGPMAGALAAKTNAKGRYYQCIRHVLSASIGGVNPPMAVEIGRRSIYMADRPSFEELEQSLRDLKGKKEGGGG